MDIEHYITPTRLFNREDFSAAYYSKLNLHIYTIFQQANQAESARCIQSLQCIADYGTLVSARYNKETPDPL